MKKGSKLIVSAVCAANLMLGALLASPASAEPLGDCTYPAAQGIETLPQYPCVAVNISGPIKFLGVPVSNSGHFDITLDYSINTLVFVRPSSGPAVAASLASYSNLLLNHSISLGPDSTVPEQVFNVDEADEAPASPSTGVAYNYLFDNLTLTSSDPMLGNFILKLDPSKDSVTQTTVTDNLDGTFTAHSFFDVFFELSLDGGTTFTPAQGGGGARFALIHTSNVPEPLSAGLMGLGLTGLAGLRARRRRKLA